MKPILTTSLKTKLVLLASSLPFVSKAGEGPIFAPSVVLDWDLTKINEFLFDNKIDPYQVRQTKLVDVDRDSDLDIQVSKNHNTLPLIYLNNGHNEFDSILEMGFPNFNLSDLYGDVQGNMSFADVDNDGLQDLIVNTRQHLWGYYSIAQTYFLLNRHTNAQPIYSDSIRTEYNFELKIVDFDLDGDDDIISIRPIFGYYPYTDPYSDLFLNTRFFENISLNNTSNFIQLEDNPFGLKIIEGFLNDSTDKLSVSSDDVFLGDFDSDSDNDFLCIGSKTSYILNGNYYNVPVNLFCANQRNQFGIDTFNIINISPNLDYNFYNGTMFNFDLDKDGDDDLIYIESNYSNLRYQLRLNFVENITTEYNSLKGTIFVDDNKNGIYDGGETPIRNSILNIDGINLTSNYFGDFELITNEPNIEELKINIDHFTPNKIVIDKKYSDFGNIDSVMVALQTDIDQIDVSFDMHFDFRPDFRYYLLVELFNRGSSTVSDTFVVKFDNSLQYDNSLDIEPISLINKKLTFTYDLLSPQELRKYIISFKPNSGTIKDTITFWGGVGPISTDVSPENNISVDTFVNKSYSEQSLIIQKSVSPKGEGAEGLIPIDTKELIYKINFYNNTSQILPNLIIYDTIDENLDISTFRLLGYNTYVFDGSNVQTSIIQPNILVFKFKDTYFNQNAEGFITYAIKPKPVTGNTIFTNSATAFYNDSLVARSNTTMNTIYLPTALYQPQKLEYSLFPNPFIEQAMIRFNNLHNKTFHLQIFATNGLLLKSFQTIGGEIIIDRSQLPSGIYLFQLTNGEETASGKFVIE